MNQASIPSEAQSKKVSWNRNFHRLIKPADNVLVLEPGHKFWWWALGSLLCFPIILLLCIKMQFKLGLSIGLCVLPFLGAGGFAFGALLSIDHGTRARFDRNEKRITITGDPFGNGLNFLWNNIQAVEFVDAGWINGPDGQWHNYEINLIINTAQTPPVTLISCGGKATVRRLAEQLASFIGVPLV